MAKKFLYVFLIVVVLFFGLHFNAYAAPKTIGYEGFLTNTAGTPQTGTHTMRVRIYDDASAGTLLYDETHTGVNVVNGYFGIPIGGGLPNGGTVASFDQLPFDQQYFLSLEVTTFATGEMSPRTPVNAVPYAYVTYGLITSTTDPASPIPGKIYFNTTDNTAYIFNGTVWKAVATSTGISSLNGQTGSSQDFAATNTGTDFSISSAGNVHSFNIPDSSATSRGLLTGLDWLTFNSKQDALGYTPLNPANNLSDLSDASIARTNLGLGTLATQSGTFSGTSSGTNTGDQTDITGNSATATALQTARLINGVSFNGTADITIADDTKVVANSPVTGATKTKITFDAKGLVIAGTDATTADIPASIDKNYVTDADLVVLSNTSGVNTGDQDLSGFLVKSNNLSDLTSASAARTNLGLGTLATQSGTFSGTSSGTNTGDQTDITGNAATATALQTARLINGVSFNGTADITVTAAAGTLTGATLNSGVTASSLTSVGTLGSLSLSGAITGATGYNGLVITANTGVVTSGTWNGATIAVANGGTGTINGSITGTTALTFAAGGSGQNVNLVPTTSGAVLVSSSTANTDTIKLLPQTAGTGATFNGIITTQDLTASDKTYTFPNSSIAVNAASDILGTTLASNVVTSSLTSVGTLTNLTVTNPISGSVTGSSGSTTGNSATATALQTARLINGVSFNGTADITVTAAAGTLTGTTLASNVVNSSLTSVGALSSGSIASGFGTIATANTISTSNNISTTGSGTITSAGLLTASNGLTQTTGALNLTGTSGALTLSGLGASSISTGGNALTFTSSNFNTTATGINSTAIGATTASTGAFTTLSSTGTTNLGQGSGIVTLNSSGALNLTGAAASTFTTGGNTLTLTSSNFNVASTGVVTLKGAQTVDLTTPAATALTIDSGSTGNLNIGNQANAKTITIGNNTGATALNITSGTGPQTFASSNATGTSATSAFVFNASALSSGTGLRLTSTSTSGLLFDQNATNTSGTINKLAYGAATTLTGTTTGLNLDLSTNVTATGVSMTGLALAMAGGTNANTSTKTGLSITSGAITQNTAVATGTYLGLDITAPALTLATGTALDGHAIRVTTGNLTQTAGTLTENGVLVDSTNSTITTGGTLNGLKVLAPTTVPVVGNYNNLFLGTSTGAAANTVDKATIAVGNIAATASNNFANLNITNGGTGFLDVELIRGFINFRDMNTLYDDFTGFSVDQAKWSPAVINGNSAANCISGAATPLLAGGLNGIFRMITGTTVNRGCRLSTQPTLSNGFYQRGNNPTFETKIRTSVIAGTRIFAGFSDTAVVNTSDTNASTHHAYIAKKAADTTWQCVTDDGGATETSTSTGVTIVANTFYRLRVEVRNGTIPQTICTVDDGTTVTRTLVTATQPGATTAMDAYIQAVTSDTTSKNIDIDYIRAWQDDPPLDGQPVLAGVASKQKLPAEDILSRMSIKQFAALVGDVSPDATNADGTDSGLSSLASAIQSESARDPVAIIAQKITDGTNFLTDFISARVTAIRGYFDQVFANTSHQKTLCVGDANNGGETCITKTQIDQLIGQQGAPLPTPTQTSAPADVKALDSTATPAVSDPSVSVPASNADSVPPADAESTASN